MLKFDVHDLAVVLDPVIHTAGAEGTDGVSAGRALTLLDLGDGLVGLGGAVGVIPAILGVVVHAGHDAVLNVDAVFGSDLDVADGERIIEGGLQRSVDGLFAKQLQPAAGDIAVRNEAGFDELAPKFLRTGSKVEPMNHRGFADRLGSKF